MAANDLIEKPAKQHATLFMLSWHNTVVRYTDWTEDVVVSPETYLTEPRIGIVLPGELGGVNERPAQLDWPITLPPADTLTSQPAHPRVQVKVWEILPGDDATLRKLYLGWVTRSQRGKRGDKNLATLRLDGIKSMLKAPLGVQVMRTCSWRFGDANCQKVVIPDLQETGTVATVTDEVITISGLTTTGTAEYWFRGWVEVDGLRLAIRRYDTPNVFYMARRPPASWSGKSILCTPGCDKTLSVCKERWDNIEHFTGLGFKMPPRHPIIEFPDVSLQAANPPSSILGEIDDLSALYDVYLEVHRAVSDVDNTIDGAPLSQLRFVEGITDTGWNTGSHSGSDYRVMTWADVGGGNRNLNQSGSVATRPKFVKASVIQGDNLVLKTPEDTGNLCGPQWDWGSSDALGGSRWALRGWVSPLDLDPACSSDFYWQAAYAMGRREPGFVSTLSNLDLIVSASNNQKFSQLNMNDPYQFHDQDAGLTFIAVCRNSVFQTVHYLTSPTELNLNSFYANHDSLIFESVGSWKLSMGGFAVQNPSGSPSEFVGNGPLGITVGSGPQSPLGINWRVCGLRVAPGDVIQSFSSHETLPFLIVDASSAPSAMAAATGYNAVSGHLECACLLMYRRALSDVELGTVVQYLAGRFKVFHPPL